MMGSFITRGFIMILGYVYPAYECFKSVERNRPDMEHLRFWCQYWMIIALVTVLERVGDALISWLPMYSEAKLAFVIYLWYPKTKGTTYVYGTFVRPFVSKHEQEIDRNLNEFRTTASLWASYYWQQGSTYFKSRFVELLQYLASQSPRSQPSAPIQRQVYPPPPPPGAMSGPLGPPGGSVRRQVIIQEDEDSDYDVVDGVPPYLPDQDVGPTGYMTRSRLRTTTRVW